MGTKLSVRVERVPLKPCEMFPARKSFWEDQREALTEDWTDQDARVIQHT